MPPPVGRYGPSGLSAPYAQQLQQAHLQQQQQQQQQSQHHHPAAAAAAAAAAHAQSANTAALPPPSLGGHPGFAAGNPNTNINPFTLSGAGITTNGMSVPGFAGAAGTAGAAGAGAADAGGTGLASHAAQMGFARGAQMQQQQLQQAHDGRLALETRAGTVKTRIRDVWKHNLAQEMAVLRHLVEKYPYISMVRSFSFRKRRVVCAYGIDLLRILSSLESSHVPSAPLPIKPITTIKPSGATSTC